MSNKEKTVLVIDDEKGVLGLLRVFFINHGYKVTIASMLREAEQIIKAQTGKIPFDVIIMDAHFPGDDSSGIDKAKKFKEKWPNMVVVVMSGYAGLFQNEIIPVDACVAKPMSLDSLGKLVESLSSQTYKRINFLNSWPNNEKIDLLSRHLGDGLEGFEGMTRDGQHLLRWDAYQLNEHIKRFPKDFFTIGVSASKGCAGGCHNCRSKERGYVRELEVGEILDQVLCGLKGYLAYRALRNYFSKKEDAIVFGLNSTCGGDWMYNQTPEKTLEAFWIVHQMNNIQARFILTSTGNPTVLNRLLKGRESRDNYFRQMRPTLYFSLNYAYQKQRVKEMKFAAGKTKDFPAGHSIPELIKLHRDFSLITGRRNTVSIVVSKGKNDSRDHAKEIARVLRGSEDFLEVKIQKAHNIPRLEPSDEKMIKFKKWILKENSGIDCRIRGIIGVKEGYGCGGTVSKKGKLPE